MRTASALGLALLALSAVATTAYLVARAPSAASAAHRVFVSNYKADTISVIDGEAAREVETIAVDSGPDGLALQADPPLLAVANGTAAKVTFIDPHALVVLGTANVGRAPESVAFAGGRLYVASTGDRVIDVLDPATHSRARDAIPTGHKPRRLLAAPDGARVYALLSAGEGEVLAIDARSGDIAARLVVGGTLRAMALTGDGRYLLVSRFDTDTVIVVDTVSFTPVATHAVTTGYGLLVHPSRPLAYSMASFDDTVFVLDLERGAVVQELGYGQWPTAGTFSPDQRHLYVVQEESDSIAKVDAATHALVIKIAVGSEPVDAVALALD